MSHSIPGVTPWPELQAAAVQADEEESSDPILHALIQEVMLLRKDVAQLALAVHHNTGTDYDQVIDVIVRNGGTP